MIQKAEDKLRRAYVTGNAFMDWFVVMRTPRCVVLWFIR